MSRAVIICARHSNPVDADCTYDCEEREQFTIKVKVIPFDLSASLNGEGVNKER